MALAVMARQITPPPRRGNNAFTAREENKLIWDAAALRFTNHEAANALLNLGDAEEALATQAQLLDLMEHFGVTSDRLTRARTAWREASATRAATITRWHEMQHAVLDEYNGSIEQDADNGEHDDGDARIQAYGAAGFEAVHAGHVHIEQHQVRPERADLFERLFRCARRRSHSPRW